MAVLTTSGLAVGGAVDVAPGQCIANETAKLTAADAVAGDFDANGAVGLNDFESFVNCMAGPGAPPNPRLPDCVDACLAAFDF